MKNFLLTSAPKLFAFFILFSIGLNAQTTVFSDDFSFSEGNGYTSSTGFIGTSTKWRNIRSGADFGSSISSNRLTLTNDIGTQANSVGWVLAYTNTDEFASPYSTSLSANPGIVTWTFNMRQSKANPSGFASNGFGIAFILAGTSGTTNLTGTGYAVTLGNGGTVDPVRLVRYDSGIRNNTTLITSNTSGLTDFGNHYISVKVTFNPATNTWQLFVRNDGLSAPANPVLGTLISQGTTVNNTYTSSNLGIMGAYYNANAQTKKTSFFNYVKLTVVSPMITSISPDAKIAGTGAFTLTVNGSGFLNGISSVQWKGSPRTTTYISPNQLSASITAADINTSGTATVTVVNSNFTSNGETFTIDPAGLPALTLSATTLNIPTTVTGTSSSAVTYNVSGVNLTSDPILNAPANFEISLNGSTYSSSLTLGRNGNNLAGQPLTIYTRLKSTTLFGIYTGNITHSSAGAVTKQITLSGKVLATQPTTQGNGLVFSSVTSNSFKVSWNNGNGSSRVLVIREGGSVNAAPTDGETYTASNVFGTGEETADGNFVVFTGAGNTVNVMGLDAATNYYVSLYEFNGTAGVENYLPTPLSSNRITLNAPVGWQIYTTNVENRIDFDQTVEGVNTNSFQGAGLSAGAESGELVSNAWAITGFSDGAIPFGGESAEDSDYDRGTSDGDETVSGLYSFEVAPDNFTLGIKPGTGDFTPGSVTLKIQNQTGTAVTSVNIGYKIYVYNNTNSATNFNFSYSSDNINYTTTAAAIVSSIATADAVPSWKASYRVLTITGLNIPANQYAYIRWTGSTASGSNNFDSFAIDDVSLVANPTTKSVSFDGTAANLAVLGNAELSNDLTVAGNITFNGGKLALNGKSLSLNGTVTNTTIGGLKGDAGSSLLMGGNSNVALSFDQTTLGTTNLLNNLSINTSNTATVTLSNALAVNGTLSVDDGKKLDLSTFALSGNLNTIVNNGTIFTKNTSTQPLTAGKNWGGTGTVHYNATTQLQTIAAGTYQNLIITTTGGGVAGGNLTIEETLNLPAANPTATTGSLSTGIYSLLMGPNAKNIGIGDVSGVISRNVVNAGVEYTFGHKYTSILFTNFGTLPSSLSIKVALGVAPTWSTGAIKRVFDFIQTGGSGTKAVIKGHYLDSELNGNVESRLVDWTYRTATSTLGEQGRSNFDTTENFIDLTNVDVAFFSASFGAVLLTFDESAAPITTWNGSVSTSWTTIGNWTPNAVPSDNTIVIIPDAATTPNDPMINPITTLGSLEIQSGGIVNVPANAQLTVNKGAGAWINQGAFNPGTGTSAVIFTNPDTTIAGATEFNNIIINAGAGLRPLSGNIMRIAGTFTQNGSFYTGSILNTVEYKGAGQTVIVPNGSLRSAYNNLIISGTSTIFPSSLNITGNYTQNQAVNFSSTTLVMAGIGNQTIGGTSVPLFNNLTINNTVGEVSLLSNATVSGTLTLSEGNIIIGTKSLTLGVNPVVGSFGVTRMIVADNAGKVRRSFTATGSYFFPIGEKISNPAYSPISVNITAGTFSAAFVGVSVFDGIHPNNYSANNYISRYWNVTQTGITNAIATINANYITPEVLAPESSMVAAQLIGTFNVQTNPWIKFQPLSGLTLTAVGASLPPSATSVFTGIKGGDFTTQISGYGEFCASEIVTLTAGTSGGDGPYLYAWSSGLGNNQVAAPNTAIVGNSNYSVTVKDANGTTATDTALITIIPPTVGGTLSANQNSCALAVPADITLSGNTGSVLYWQSDTDSNFGNPTNISNTTSVLSGTQMGQITATTYFRAVVKNGSCDESYSTTSAVILKSTTWNGTSWSNGLPDGSTSAEIIANFSATANLTACTMTVSNDALVVIPSNYTVTLNGPINVISGSFTLENNASLLQLTNIENSGNIKVKRTSSPLFRLDYTMWSSPVFGSQTLRQFSPSTTANRFYTFNSTTNVFTACDPDLTTFAKGAGYLIRIRNNHIDYSQNAVPQTWTGTFEGRANNGPIAQMASVSGQRYNLIGNPYPSRIDAQAFLDQNSGSIDGTIYFWRRKNNAPVDGELVSAYYATYTKAGGVRVEPEVNASDSSQEPNGYIQIGQGFIAKTLAAPVQAEIVFQNSMRSDSANDGQFFRMANEDRSRIWLNVNNQNGAFGQTLIAYMNDSNNGIDRNDGQFFNEANFALSSLIEDKEYIIQARAPFVETDVVALNFKTPNPGNYTIAIDHVDGLFSGNQVIFLNDLMTGSSHDLKSGPYTFTSEAGNFSERFQLSYETALSTDENIGNRNSIIAYKQGSEIVVSAGQETIGEVQIIDMGGRLLSSKKGVNASECRILGPTAQQVLIVRISMLNGATYSKKIVY